MQRRTRQALLIAATTAFVTITPLLVLYALGYRIASPRIGVLLIESTPSRAVVTVNGEAAGVTPQTVTDVESDSVHMTVSKSGYLTWEKQLPLVRGGATEVRSVRLFPEKLIADIFAESVHRFSLSPNRAYVAIVDKHQRLSVIDEDGNVIVPTQTLSRIPDQLLWSPDSRSVLIAREGEAPLLLQVGEARLRLLTLPSYAVLSSIVWDPRLPGRLLALTQASELIAFDIATGVVENIASNVTAFAPTNHTLFVVSRAQTLMLLDSLGHAIAAPLLLPQGVSRLVATPTGSLAIIFADHTAATLTADRALQPLANAVQELGFSPDGEVLYVQTAPHELMAYNLSDEQNQYLPLHRLHLITRISETLHHPQWFAGGEHLIYQIADRIVITEVDTRDHAITTEIDSTNLSDSQIAVGRDGHSLFYLKRTGDNIHLMRTALLAE